MSHPLAHETNLVTVYGCLCSPHHGISISMEYVSKSLLTAAFANNSTIASNLSIRERLHIALGMTKGLNKLHLVQLTHPDFKPENVLLSRLFNGNYMPKVADFGVSFQLIITSAKFVKKSRDTADYDAPEVAVDNKIPSVNSHIYALVFTLSELLPA
ncbi:unnamed protein product [Rotaria sp. Silwood1]|nr:unnamed protein product [Rotaria sp. Silwood1]